MNAKKRRRLTRQSYQSTPAPPVATGWHATFKRPTERAAIVISAVLLCFLAFAAYANAFGNGFVWDDHQQVAMNSSLRPGAPWLQLAGANIWGFSHGGVRDKINYYRPLQMVVYRLTAEAFGFEARAFHAVNIVFHAVVALLAFALFHKLTGRAFLAFAAAALFAAHPIHTEAVDWIAALPDIGCTASFLLAFLLFVLGCDQPSEPQPPNPPRRRVLLLAASYAAFALSLLWKETAIVFPLIVVAYTLSFGESTQLSSRIARAVKRSLPYWCILGFYFLLRFRVLGFLVTNQRNWIMSRFEQSLTTISLMSEYCWKLIAPFQLNAYHVFVPVRSLGDPRAIASILFLLLAAIAIVYGLRRAPLISFAALWVFITLIPVLNVYAVGRNVFAERYLYLPSVGFCLLLVLLAAHIGRYFPDRLRPYAAAALLAVTLLFFTAQTFARNPVWKDDTTLFTRTLESSPNAPFVQNMVAAVQPNTSLGQSSAESHYLRAISLAENEVPPNRLEIVTANQGLASIYAARGEFQQALRALAQVRATDPKDPQVDGEEGLILMQANHWPEAQATLRRAVAIAPNDPNVLNALGLLAWQHEGNLDQATAYFSRAIVAHSEADDFNASLHNNLGAIYGQQGRYSDAIAEFGIAVRITPNDPEYLTNLGTAFAAIGRTGDARRLLQAALAAAPNYSPARAAFEQIGPK